MFGGFLPIALQMGEVKFVIFPHTCNEVYKLKLSAIGHLIYSERNARY